VWCGQGYGGQTGTRRLGSSARARLAVPNTRTRLPVGAQNDWASIVTQLMQLRRAARGWRRCVCVGRAPRHPTSYLLTTSGSLPCPSAGSVPPRAACSSRQQASPARPAAAERTAMRSFSLRSPTCHPPHQPGAPGAGRLRQAGPGHRA
jgi:hypothetical protein